MQQCHHCNYLVPQGYFTCPHCQLPVTAGVPTPASIYGNAMAKRSNPLQTLIVGSLVVLALLAGVVFAFVKKGGEGGGKNDITKDLAEVKADGWRVISPTGAAFKAEFPGAPQHTTADLKDLTGQTESYLITDGDFKYGVVMVPSPMFVSATDAGQLLSDWLKGTRSPEAVVEGESIMRSPWGHQVVDYVTVEAGTRSWVRLSAWNGTMYMAIASLPADKQPTAAQSAAYSRMRDSLRQF